MRAKLLLLAVVILTLTVSGCIPAYQTPYLSLSLKSVYSVSDITINYTYVCEEQDQRCVYKLYNKAEPSTVLDSRDEIMSSTGSMSFNGLEEGSYRLEFAVYSSKDGNSSLLKFLDEYYEFAVDLP